MLFYSFIWYVIFFLLPFSRLIWLSSFLYILCLIAWEISLCYAHTNESQENLKKTDAWNIIRKVMLGQLPSSHTDRIVWECVMDKIYLNDENGVAISVKAAILALSLCKTKQAKRATAKVRAGKKNATIIVHTSNSKKAREMSCG